jgi:hypothetical protein
VREITTPDARAATTFRRPRVFNGASILHLLLCAMRSHLPRGWSGTSSCRGASSALHINRWFGGFVTATK